MPLKTWVDYERLEAPDLNSAFAWSQDQTVPGAVCFNSGPDTASITGGSYGEVRHGAPDAGADPLGIYRSSDGRLVIPQAGLWLYTSATIGFNAVAEPASMQVWISVDGVRGINLASCPRTTGASSNAAAGTFAAMLSAGQVLFAEARMINGAGNAALRRWSLVRLGRGIGPVGS